ncbi:hypothetical protein FA95DRAFT_1191290 [Auriscalpium vulgare]|uniref:Uncharacterized protein n=1 Tax=Auriscalpium vulgare TaxID=40419 RepID=A0ACB8RW52_9AGAM|nr:hypothetical protein FA95DRAFT_1191290 [Auriscalpium vulgare]
MPPSPRPTRAATAASTASTRTTQTTTTTTTTTRSTTRTNKASTNTTTQVPTSGRARAIQAVRDKMEAHRLATTAAKRTLTRLEGSSPPPSPHLPHSPATRASSRRIPNSRPTPEKAQRRMSAPQPSKDVVRKLTTLATKPASRTATKSLTASGKPRPPLTSPHLSTTKPLKAPSPSARPSPHSQAPAKSPRQSSLVRHAIPARQPRPPVPTRKLPDITKAPEPPTQLIDSEMTAAMPAKPSEESLASRFFADENESEGGLRPSLNEDLAPMAIVEPADMSRMQALEGMSSSIPSDENSEHAALYTASLTPIALEDCELHLILLASSILTFLSITELEFILLPNIASQERDRLYRPQQ